MVAIDHPINPASHRWQGNVKKDIPMYEKMKFSARKFSKPKNFTVLSFDSSDKFEYV